MADYILEAESRSITGKKVGRLRREGMVPATLYGPKIEPISLQFPYRVIEVALMQAGGTNLIDIKVNGKSYPALAREVQRDVIRGSITHVDFFAVDMLAKIRAEVPVHLIGESPFVVARKGVLLTGPSSITVEALPAKLMHAIEIDLSQLVNLGDAVHVSDLEMDEGVAVLNDPDEVIVRVVQTSAARAAEMAQDEEEEVESQSSEPEVISRGRGEEDED